jgi:hypothetical protein
MKRISGIAAIAPMVGPRADNPSQEISASERIWEFFSRFHL